MTLVASGFYYYAASEILSEFFVMNDFLKECMNLSLILVFDRSF